MKIKPNSKSDFEMLMSFFSNNIEDNNNKLRKEFSEKLYELEKKIIESKAEKKIEETKSYSEVQFQGNKLREKWEENKKYFFEHEDVLAEKYPGLYVAIHDGIVIETDETLGNLDGKIFEKHGNIPVYANIPGKESVESLILPLEC